MALMRVAVCLLWWPAVAPTPMTHAAGAGSRE
eukprot:COSAG05_NODE_13217_length_438_cov_0.607670_2_plen_31_part_01